MRNCTFVVTLLALFFTGCEEATIKVGKDFLSHKTSEFDITIAYPVFTSQKAEVERGCKVVNEEISRLIDSLQNDLKAQLNQYLQKAREMKEEPMIPFELEVKEELDDELQLLRHAIKTTFFRINHLTICWWFLCTGRIIQNGILLSRLLRDRVHPERCCTRYSSENIPKDIIIASSLLLRRTQG